MQKMIVESGTKQSHIKDHADKSRVKRLQNGKQEKYEKTVRKLKDECQKVRVRPKTTGETRNEPDTTFQQKQKHSHPENVSKNSKQLSDALSTVQTEEKK